MLWSEIVSVRTWEGQVLVGEQVRDWLINKRKGIVSKAADVHVPMRDHRGWMLTLRTREELAAWLTTVHRCADIRFSPVPVDDPGVRHVARSRGVGNSNDVRPVVYFTRAGEDTPLARVSVEHGLAPLALEVRIKPALPHGARLRLELAYIDAKLRIRNAVRAAVRADPAYRYLSRIRVARSDDAIRRPITELDEGALSTWYTAAGGGASALVDTFSIVGLEPGHGPERLQVCIFEAQRHLLASATLTVDVTAQREMDGAPAERGSTRVLRHTTGKDYLTADPEFAAIHAAASQPGARVRVAICDSGVFDDGEDRGLGYLAKRLVAGRYFSGAGEGEDLPTRRGEAPAPTILERNPSKHGTTVAGQAAWGSPGIELVDVMVKCGQVADLMDDATSARALAWALTQEVTVVNCSAWMPFSAPATARVVSSALARRETLFLATAGNSAMTFPLNFPTFVEHGRISGNEFKPSDLPASFENTLLVGGCKSDRGAHPQRGAGPGVDVLAPSDSQPLYAPTRLVELFRLHVVRAVFREFLLEILQPMIEGLKGEDAEIFDDSSEYTLARGELRKLESDILEAEELLVSKKVDDQPLSALDKERWQELEKTKILPGDPRRLELDEFSRRHQISQAEQTLSRRGALVDKREEVRVLAEKRPRIPNPRFAQRACAMALRDDLLAWMGAPGLDLAAVSPEDLRDRVDAAIPTSEPAVELLGLIYDVAGMAHEWRPDPRLGDPARRQRATELRQMMIDAKQESTVMDRICIVMRVKSVEAAYQDLCKALLGTHFSRDEGVSFGLPIVANIAAKLKMIRPGLTANELKRILIDSSDRDPALGNRCIAGGVVNPLRAYFAALDGTVTSRGRDPHLAFRQRAPSGANERRRIYFTFYYMEAEGLRVYEAIKSSLIDAYAALDVELIEAEPPIEIEAEPLTFVAGKALGGRDWKQSVAPQTHPLFDPRRHLRLILVNQCGYVVSDTLDAKVADYATKFDIGGFALTDGTPPPYAIERADARPAADETWTCKLRARPNHVFPREAEHALDALTVTSLQVQDGRLASNLYRAARTGNNKLKLTLKAADIGGEFAQCTALTVTLRIAPAPAPAPGGPPPPPPKAVPHVVRLEPDQGVWKAVGQLPEDLQVTDLAPPLAGDWVLDLALGNGRTFPATSIVSEVSATMPRPAARSLTIADPGVAVERVGDAEIVVSIDGVHLATCTELKLRANIIQAIGGNRDGRNIFVSNRYHAGDADTETTDASVRVLFLHEIGHALGMVPKGRADHYDRSFGGVGDHCSFNAVKLPNDDAWATYAVLPDGKSGEVYVPRSLVEADPDPTARAACVMYHTRTAAHRHSKFCPACERSIRTELDPGKWGDGWT